MRWVFASVAVVVVGGVAAFSIYTWGWRTDTGSAELARLDAQVVEQSDACLVPSSPTCPRIGDVNRLAGSLWRVELAGATFTDKGSTYGLCLMIDVRRFQATGYGAKGGPRFDGVSLGRC